jgi:hypothetical protein
MRNDMIKRIKRYIYNNGGVTNDIYLPQKEYPYTDKTIWAHYYNPPAHDNPLSDGSFAGKITGHAVTLVGWNDSYSKDNFKSSHKPANNGAFLAKNSWNENWGNSGYFWYSYEDIYLGFQGGTVAEVRDRDFFDNIYQYDQLGFAYNSYYGDLKSAYIANIFKTETENETVTAAAFMTTQEYVSYEIYVMDKVMFYTASEDFEITPEGRYIAQINLENSFTSADLRATGMVVDAGFHTVDFDKPIYLDGRDFTVIVKLTAQPSSSSPIYLPTENDINLPGTTAYAKSNINECYTFLYNNGKVNSVYDLGHFGESNCLKAFTKNAVQSLYAVDENDEIMTNSVSAGTLKFTAKLDISRVIPGSKAAIAVYNSENRITNIEYVTVNDDDGDGFFSRNVNIPGIAAGSKFKIIALDSATMQPMLSEAYVVDVDYYQFRLHNA